MFRRYFGLLAPTAGLEPATLCLTGTRSYHLSYIGIYHLFFGRGRSGIKRRVLGSLPTGLSFDEGVVSDPVFIHCTIPVITTRYPCYPPGPWYPSKKILGYYVCLNYSENPYLRNSCILITPVIVGISTILAVLWSVCCIYVYSVMLLYAMNIRCLCNI